MTHTDTNVAWEAHKSYADIHYIIAGNENIGYCSIKKLNIMKEYNETADAIIGTADGEFIVLEKGNYLLLMPDMAHLPGITTGEQCIVKKAVFKVKIL